MQEVEAHQQHHGNRMGKSEVPAGLTWHLSRVEQVEGDSAQGPQRQYRAVVREQRQDEEPNVTQERAALRRPTVLGAAARAPPPPAPVGACRDA